MVKALIASGDNVVIMSGRDGSAEQATREWLTKHVAPDLPLHMRQPGDMRPDSIVKYELFSAHIAESNSNYQPSKSLKVIFNRYELLKFPCY